MKSLIRVLLPACAFFMTACTSMSKKDCERANWFSLGKEDAIDGQTLESFKRRENQCFEHGLLAEREKYVSGYAAGLKLFCTYESGQKFGYSEHRYENQCPNSLEPEFLKGYKLGKAEAERDAYERQLEEERKANEERLAQQRRDNEELLRQQQEEMQRQQDELNRQNSF